jgi:hypothetical protein
MSKKYKAILRRMGEESDKLGRLKFEGEEEMVRDAIETLTQEHDWELEMFLGQPD